MTGPLDFHVFLRHERGQYMHAKARHGRMEARPVKFESYDVYLLLNHE